MVPRWQHPRASGSDTKFDAPAAPVIERKRQEAKNMVTRYVLALRSHLQESNDDLDMAEKEIG